MFRGTEPGSAINDQVQGMLRSHTLRHDFGPSRLFAAMNEHLFRNTAGEQFMTLFYGVLNDRDRTLRWCSAGHGPFFFIATGRKTSSNSAAPGYPWESMIYERHNIPYFREICAKASLASSSLVPLPERT